MSDPAPTPPAPRDPRFILAGLAVIVTGLGVALWQFKREPKPVAAAAPAVIAPATPAPEPEPEPEIPPPDTRPVFTLGKVTLMPVEDAEAAQKYTLSVPLIKARSDVKIVGRDLVIEVRFYDSIDDGKVVMTRAQIKSRWAAPPADWSSEEGETLEVDYTLAKPATPAEKAEARKFYGRLVRVYYADLLQGVEAEPAELAERFPTPQVREEEEAPK